MPTGINYLDETWNLILGCNHASSGCSNCWAEGVSHAHASHPNPKISGAYKGVTKNGKWTGKVKCLEGRLTIPLHWKKPRTIGVSFMGDLFHEDVPTNFIGKVLAVMALCPQHQFLILTKRPERLKNFMTIIGLEHEIGKIAYNVAEENGIDWDWRWRKYETATGEKRWPLPNVMLGVSVEDQKTADERIPLLLQTPATKRFVSYEPALGPVIFSGAWNDYLNGWAPRDHPDSLRKPTNKLDLIIMGGESGPGFRSMDLSWARSVMNQCHWANTCFFFKQVAGKGPIPKDLMIRQWPSKYNS